MRSTLTGAISGLGELLPKLAAMEPQLTKLGETMLACWARRGKVMTCGNGGSAADALHLAEELSVRYGKNRRALAAVALCDATAMTCAGNDFGFDAVFARQVEALGNPGDVLIVFSTSGNSPNIVRALETARTAGVTTVGFLGKGGGKAMALCDQALLIPADKTPRIQEATLLMYHVLCEWIEARVD